MAERRRWFTCDDVVAACGLPDEHCNSCHQDDEEDYSPMCQIDDDRDVAPVCCTVLNRLRSVYKRDDEKILDKVRLSSPEGSKADG